MNAEDHVLEVLLEVCRTRKNEVDPALLRRAYEIQKRHQHSKDPNQSLDELRKLVEQFVRDDLDSKGN